MSNLERSIGQQLGEAMARQVDWDSNVELRSWLEAGDYCDWAPPKPSWWRRFLMWLTRISEEDIDGD